MRIPRTTLAATAVGAALLIGSASPAGATEVTGTTVLDRGHVDVFGVAYADGELDLHIHAENDGGEVELDPAQTVLQVNPEALTTVPDNPEYAFLGEPGDDVWILPDTSEPDLLFAGWGAEEVPDGAFVDDELELSLVRTSGPGEFSLFAVDDFGSPDVLFHSDGDAPNSLAVSAGGHGHMNWGFTDPGCYRVTVAVTGELAGGGTVTDRATYRFTVLP